MIRSCGLYSRAAWAGRLGLRAATGNSYRDHAGQQRSTWNPVYCGPAVAAAAAAALLWAGSQQALCDPEPPAAESKPRERVYRRAEVQQHCSADSAWVTFKDGVYDVTEFVSSHPGGAEKLLQAAGGDLFPLWRQLAFREHFSSPLAAELLAEMRIGSLHTEDIMQATGLEEAVAQYSNKKIYDCIIVGAGVSGLRCGHALTSEHGVNSEDILLLEAQDYVGGRVRQVSEFIKGVHVDVGAEFLHGTDTELTRLAAAAGEPTTEIYCWAHGDGGPLQEPVRKGYGLYYIGGKGNPARLLRYDAPDAEFQRLNEALWDLKNLSEADFEDSYTLNDYLVGKRFGRDMLTMANAGFANTLCSNDRGLSLKRVIKWCRLWDEEGEEEGDFSVDNSWRNLLGYLKRDLQIEISSPVSSIQYIPQEKSEGRPFSELVKVETKGGTTYYARTVVVTASPHVLKSELLRFDPPLSGLREALDTVNMNSIVKVFLKFSRPVWPKNLAGMVIADDDFLLPEIWFKDVSGQAAADEPAKAYAVAFTTTDYARKLASLPRQEVMKKSIEQLDKMFSLLEPRHMSADPADPNKELPRELPTPSSALLGAMYWDWTPEHHPYIGGGYCSPKANTDTDRMDKLRLPYGNENIFFAGEATNLPGATAHAALESGVRAARQVSSVISKGNDKK